MRSVVLNPSLWDPETIVDDNLWLKSTHIFIWKLCFSETLSYEFNFLICQWLRLEHVKQEKNIILQSSSTCRYLKNVIFLVRSTTYILYWRKEEFFFRIMTILTNFPTNFFLLFEELIFLSSISTFYRRPLSIWFLQPLWDGRWSSTKQYEKKKISWKYVGIVVLFFLHLMVVQRSLILFFSSFIFLSLASTTIKLVLIVILMFKENYLMLNDPT